MLHFATVVTGSEDDEATLHGTHLVAVFVHSGFGVEVVDGFLEGLRGGGFVVRIAPAAVHENGAVVGGINDGGFRKAAILLFIHHLGDHEAHAGIRSTVTSGHTAYSNTVVVHGRHGTGNVGSVVTRINFSNRGFAVVSDEIVSVDVVHVAVVVVIFSRQAVEFGLVYPHVGGQVFMGVIHTHVVDGHNDFGIAGFNGPGFEGIDIAAFGVLVSIAEILVMPLRGKSGVVERIIGLAHSLYFRDKLHNVNQVLVQQGIAGLGERQGFVKDEVVPQVQAGSPVTGFPFACFRESPNHGIVAQGRQVQPGGLGVRYLVF